MFKSSSGFMKPVVEYGTWIMVDGPMGVEWVAADLVDLAEVDLLIKQLAEETVLNLEETSLKNYCENREANSIEVVKGYSAYLSAPGYLDRTENVVFSTKQEALDYLEETYEEEDEEDEEDVYEDERRSSTLRFGLSSDPSNRAYERMDAAARRGGLQALITESMKRAKVAQNPAKLKGIVDVATDLIADLETLKKFAVSKLRSLL